MTGRRRSGRRSAQKGGPARATITAAREADVLHVAFDTVPTVEVRQALMAAGYRWWRPGAYWFGPAHSLPACVQQAAAPAPAAVPQGVPSVCPDCGDHAPLSPVDLGAGIVRMVCAICRETY